jgi:hypothetical protein
MVYARANGTQVSCGHCHAGRTPEGAALSYGYDGR